MKFVPLVWAGLWRKPWRTGLTALAITIAFVLVGLLQTVNAGFDSLLGSLHQSRLFVYSRTGALPLPMSHLPAIDAIPGVAAVAYDSFFGGYYQDQKNNLGIYPTDPERLFAVYQEYSIAPEHLAALIKTRDGAVVGRKDAAKYGWKIGDRISLVAAMQMKKDGRPDWSFEIVGFFENPTGRALVDGIVCNYSYFDEMRMTEKGMTGWYIVRVAAPAQAQQVAAAIDARFANSTGETRTEPDGQGLLRFVSAVRFITYGIMSVSVASLLLITAFVMAQSVRERTRELGVLKALGFSDGQVQILCFAESVALSLGAALAGLGIAAGLTLLPLIRRHIQGENWAGSRELLVGIAAALLIAFAASLGPARRAGRLSPVQAMAEG